MRVKKKREVNIFSASVVDLFASGLGVFLIVSIIALVNQRKEIGKSELASVYDHSNLKSKIDKLEQQLFAMKVKGGKKIERETQVEEVTNLKLDFAVEKSKFKRKNAMLQEQLTQTKVELEKANKVISELKFREQYTKSANLKKGMNFAQFNVGSKIRLMNVHFYPGTSHPIEPYASREISEFATFMQTYPKMIIEVSGHIFETKKAIEEGMADDEYNLSGARAKKVCEILMKFGISAERLKCLGYGASRSIYLTDDQYSLEAQKNRRVEIEILSK